MDFPHLDRGIEATFSRSLCNDYHHEMEIVCVDDSAISDLEDDLEKSGIHNVFGLSSVHRQNHLT